MKKKNNQKRNSQKKKGKIRKWVLNIQHFKYGKGTYLVVETETGTHYLSLN